jgi:hypothetical protein
MQGIELRLRLNQLGRSYVELAPMLGLSIWALHKQMNGQSPVSAQTEIILKVLELRAARTEQGAKRAERNARARSDHERNERMHSERAVEAITKASAPKPASPPPPVSRGWGPRF